MTCEYIADFTANTYNVSINTFTNNVIVATAGQQGPRGDSISNVYLVGGVIFVDVTDASGNYTTTYEVGSLSLDPDFWPNVTAPQEGDILQYNSTSNTFTNHQLTTSRVLDIDNTNKQDGAMLIYKGSTSKYTATTNLDSTNLALIGGTY